MEENLKEVTQKDVLKHYLSSILVYGIILLLVAISPLFNQDFEWGYFNYITVLSIYYVLYILFAYPILLKRKPESILNSRSVAIINYFKKQFNRGITITERLNNVTPSENEKQAFVIMFVKAFFTVIGLNLLCNKYLPMIGYDIDFMKTMFEQATQYSLNSGIFMAIAQYLEDTQDMWLTIMFTITTAVLTFSYMTETRILGNKIKYADTTPLGIISCLMCYYPLILLTNKLLPLNQRELIPLENITIRTFVYIIILIANFGILIATLRLGTKSGNLTNRGIVTGFPYNIVRHPDYSMQILYIIATSIPVYFIPDISIFTKILGTTGVILWIYLYYLRAITEERNLIEDEKYAEYTQKVKYRFIPKLF